MTNSPERDLNPEQVRDLNTDLTQLRGLYSPQATALGGLYEVVQGIEKHFRLEVSGLKLPDEKPPRGDAELISIASSIPAIMEKRASYGRAAVQLRYKLTRLVGTRGDGSTIYGSIDPRFVNHDSTPERTYIGDDPEIPRLYIVSSHLQGRVVQTHWYPGNGRSGSDDKLGIWVWPNNIREWTNGRHDSSRHVSLLDDSVEFVEHVRGCKLPAPETYNPKYQLAIMD